MTTAALRQSLPMESLERSEVHLRPLSTRLAQWNKFVASVRTATLYHRGPWLDLLREAHGVEIQVATVEAGSEIIAGCLLARSRRPFSRRLISLPHCDLCPPLSKDGNGLAALFDGLARTGHRYELRGVLAPAPWKAVDCFAHWSISMQRPIEMVHPDFRRNARRAAEAGVRVSKGSGLEYVKRFYTLQLATRRRQGIPPRPFRYFRALHRIFSARGQVEVWLAQHNGRDAAAQLLIRDGDCIYGAGNARAMHLPRGANHMLFMNVIEEYDGRVRAWHLGRTDVRNRGLNDFKRHSGAVATPLPYSFLPVTPCRVSAEVLSGPTRIASSLWRRLPLWSTRVLGATIYEMIA